VSVLMQPTEVESCLTTAMPCLVQHSGVFALLKWLGSIMGPISKKQQFKQVVSRILFGLLRTTSEPCSNLVACHEAESVEAVEALLTTFGDFDLARSKDGKEAKLLPLQVLCVEAEIINTHSVKIAKALRRRAPEVQQLPLPKAKRHNSVGGVFVATAEAEVRHRRVTGTDLEQVAALKELEEALTMPLAAASQPSPGQQILSSLALPVDRTRPACRPLQRSPTPHMEIDMRSKRSSSVSGGGTKSPIGSRAEAHAKPGKLLPPLVLQVTAASRIDRASQMPAWKAGQLGIMDAESHKKLAVRGSSLGRYW